MERGYFASIYLPELTLVVDQLCIYTAQRDTVYSSAQLAVASLELVCSHRSPTNLSTRPTHGLPLTA